MTEKKSDAEKVLNKSESEMSETEKLMAEIINSKAPEDEENTAETPSEEQMPEATEKKKDDRLPVFSHKPTVTFKSSADREKNVGKALKRSRASMSIMTFFTIMLLAGTTLFISMVKSVKNSDAIEADNISAETPALSETLAAVLPEGMIIPTPEPSSELGENGEMTETGTPPDAIVIMSGTSEENKTESEPEAREHYEVVIKDGSWEEAREAAELAGGHLVTVSDYDEFQKCVKLAIDAGIDILWIGCHRENGAYIWENGEEIDIDGIGAWGVGEPSYTDQGAPEDYIMLWFMNNRWCLNDSSNDPCSEYPRDYCGKIGYIIEYED